MDELFGFILGFFAGWLISIISIVWSMVTMEVTTIVPVKDNYRNEILYYVDTVTEKTYKIENDILYYYEV